MTKQPPSPEIIRAERAFQVYLALLNSNLDKFVDWGDELVEDENNKIVDYEERPELSETKTIELFPSEDQWGLLTCHFAELAFDAVDNFINYHEELIDNETEMQKFVDPEN